MSDAASFRRLRDVVQRAGALADEARSRYLDETCAGEPHLRAEVLRLLAAESVATGSILGDAAGDGPPPPPRVGPYVLEAEIGRGGMGVVHRGRDERNGATVAVKLIRPHLVARPAARERFEREARAGLRVVHPNVVRTLDVVAGGDDDAPLALVLEHVEGRDLRALLRELTTVPEGLLREIAAQCAAGLAAIHEAGFVHRDVKPENVVVTADRRVRIMDLGIAKSAGAAVDGTVLTQEGQFLGTLAYAAPEQVEARDVGPPADLYSLGVVLYELATGRNPFDRGNLAATVRAHADLVPPPVREVDPDMSPFLSAVVATLLAKDPAARFPSAAALHRALADGEGGAWWALHSPAAPAAALPAARVPVGRTLAFHGRAAELAVLREAFEEARAGRGGAVLVTAESGLGRTRLVAEFLDSVAAESAHVLYGAEPPVGGPSCSLSESVRGLLGEAGLPDEIRRRLGDAAPIAESLADVILCAPSPGDREPLDGDAVTAGLCSLLRGLARERPTVWVLEDLQFAPPGRRVVVAAMARAAAAHRALLVVTATEDLPPDSVVGPVRSDPVRRIRLAPLDADAVGAVLRDAFGSDTLAERLARPLHERSAGSPLHLAALVRTLRQEGFVRTLPEGGAALDRPLAELAAPSNAREAVRDRIAALPHDEREILDVAAAQGFEFDADLVADVTGRPAVGVLRVLADLERRRSLVRSRGRLHRFTHHVLHAVLVEELPERLREEYHALLAEAHARRASRPGRAVGDADAAFIARHHLLGVRPESATPWLDAALAHHVQGGYAESAVELIDLVLRRAPPSDPRRRIDLLLRKAALHDVAGERDPQRDAAFAAAAEAEALGDDALRARAAAGIGRLHVARSQMEEALPWLTRARDLAERAGDGAEAVRAWCVLGDALTGLNRLPEAQAELERCLERARSLGDPHAEGLVRSQLGHVLHRREDIPRARELLEAACGLLAPTGDRRAWGRALERLGRACLDGREVASAAGHLGTALAVACATGDRQLESLARGSIGSMHYREGRLADARAAYVRHLEIATEVGEPLGVARSAANVALVDGLLGRHAEALAGAARALAVVEDLRNARLTFYARLVSGVVRAESGDLDGAGRDFEAAIGAARAAGDPFAESEASIELAVVRHRAGAPRQECLARLRAARELAVSTGAATNALFADLRAAAFAGADASAAVEEYRRQVPDLTAMERIWFPAMLWKATGAEEHLAAAHAELCRVRDLLPPEDREAFVRGTLLHREIADARR